MAHFAELDENNLVKRVIAVNNNDMLKNGIEDEEAGKRFCINLLGGKWIQTSYNNNFRRRYAGIGMKYDETLNIFILKQPFPSWILDSAGEWQAPISKPEDNKLYLWNEKELKWVELVIPIKGDD